jgi:solute:Na+ symporter, SSS family
MSTLSSVLNSLATVTVNDFYKRVRPLKTEAHYVRMARTCTTVWGILAIFTALLTVNLDKFVALACFKGASLFMGAMLGTFLLGMLSRRATPLGGFVGCLLGVIATFVAGFATPLEMFWLTAIGTGVTLLTGLVISTIWPPTPDQMAHNEQLTFFGAQKTSNSMRLETRDVHSATKS